jgi:Tfp pilus assembly protein PilF
MRLITAYLVLLALVGCQAPGPTARDEANKTWSAARAQVKYRLAADQLTVGNLPAAAVELQEATRLDPDNPLSPALRARLLLAEGHVTGAADLLAANQGAGPRQADSAYLLGIARQQQQRWTEALAAFQRAYETDPEQVAYLAAVVQTLLQLERPDDALATLTAARERCGWSAAYQAALAECHEQRGDWSAAATAWQAVAGAPSSDAELRERWARALCRAARFTEARGVLRELRAAAPADAGSVGVRLLSAECALAEGDLAAAQAELRSVLRADAEHGGALRLLARCRAQAGDYEGAWQLAERLRQAAPRDVHTLELCAALAWRAGRQEAAVAAAGALAALMPDNAVAAYLRDAGARPAATALPR